MKQEISFENPDTIVMKLRGEWLPEEAVEVYDKLDQFKEGLETLKCLVDVTDLENIPPKSREIATKRSRSVEADKLAVIGASAKVRMLGTLMLKLIPRVKKAKFFEIEEEARAWLAEKQ